MAYELRDNSGTIFVNNRKDKDTHPDRTGTCMIDGKEYFINGWLKDGKNGQFLSLSFKPKDFAQKPQGSLGSKGRSETYADAKGRDPISTGPQTFDDPDIPF